KHNNAFNSIMWYGSVFTPSVNSGSRRIFLNIMDYFGGAQLVTDSKNISYQANCSFFAINTENCTGAIGIKENGFDSDNVTVQPNPFGDDLIIKIKTDVKSNINIKINDLLGKTIKTFENLQGAIGETSVSYDGKELPSGVYFMSIQINNSLVVKKVIKR
ncbi:MAG: T9SS type A sorting domain-containing protein, partial [Dolichospermum sp.]